MKFNKNTKGVTTVEYAIIALMIVTIIVSSTVVLYVVPLSSTISDISTNLTSLIDEIAELNLTEPSEGGELVIGTIGSAKHLDPVKFMGGHHEYLLHRMVNMPILMLDKNGFDVDFERSFGTKYEQIDALTWDIWLRDDCRYSNGKVATAEDAKFDVDRLRGFTEYPPSKFQFIIGGIESCEVVEPLHIRFHLNKQVQWLHQIMHFFQPENEDNIDELGEDYDTYYPGTGPWMCVSWVRDSEIVFEPNPYYAGPKPKLDKLTMKFFADPSTLRLALEKGDIDLIERGLLLSDYVDLARNPDVKATIVYGNPAMRYFTFNKALCPELEDVKVRRAIAHALDRSEIVSVNYKGYADECWSFLPKPFEEYAVDTFKRYPYNLTRAQELLAEAGYPDGFGPYEFWYSTEYMGPQEREVTTLITAQLAKIGVTLTPKDVDLATFLERGYSATIPGATLNKWTWDWPDPDDLMNVPCPGRTNVVIGAGWIDEDPEIAALQVTERTSTDPSVRKAAFTEMQEKLTDMVTIVPIYNMPDYLWMRGNVHGLSSSYYGADYFFDFSEVWVD